MCQNIRISGYQIIRFLIIIFLHLSFVICHLSFAQEVPRFYGEEVVVTALKVPRLKSSIPWNTKLITRQEIEESTSVKLGDIIRSVSGLSVKSNGGLNSIITSRFRGSSGEQVLVLLNGNRINSPNLGTFDLGDILLTDVERIEIIKSPLSALYGADAIGGVINVITRQATTEAELKLAASYGEFNTQSLSVSGSGQHYYFAAAQLRSDGFRENSDYKAQDYNLRFFGNLGLADLAGGFKKYDAEKGSPGSLDFLTPQARQTDNNLFYDLVCGVDKYGLKVTLSQNILDQNYKNPASFPPVDTTNKTITTIINVQENYDWGEDHAFTVGGDYRRDKSESSNSGKHELSTKAVYLQDEIKLPGAAKLVVGGRQDSNIAYGSHFSPRIGCVVNPSNDVQLKISWASSFRSPTFNELYWTRLTESFSYGGVTYTSTTEGNPGLSVEQAQSIDLTVERKFGPESQARLSFYTSQIKDMIRWTNTSTSLTDSYYTPLNIAEVNIQGVEFEYNKQVNKDIEGFVNFTYEEAKDKATENFLNYAPQLKYNAGLKHRGPCFTSNIIIKHVGERYTNLLNTNKLAPYSVVDLSLIKDLGRWEVKLDIENLFNESYAESYGFSDVYPMPGRRYNIGVSCRI